MFFKVNATFAFDDGYDYVRTRTESERMANFYQKLIEDSISKSSRFIKNVDVNLYYDKPIEM